MFLSWHFCKCAVMFVSTVCLWGRAELGARLDLPKLDSNDYLPDCVDAAPVSLWQTHSQVPASYR